MPPHALKLADPNVIDEELIRNHITTVEEIKLSDEKKKELRNTELHDIKVLPMSFQNTNFANHLDCSLFAGS